MRSALCALRLAKLAAAGKTARAADDAATLMFHRCTTVRAGTHFGHHVGETALAVFIDYPGNGVRATEYHLTVLPDG